MNEEQIKLLKALQWIVGNNSNLLRDEAFDVHEDLLQLAKDHNIKV